MNILRLSTLSLTLAIVVFALGSANPSFAAPKTVDCDDPDEQHPSCKDKDESGRDETFYDVVIGPAAANGGDIDGESDLEHPWLTFGKGTSIGLGDATLSPPGPDRPGIGEFTDLSFFSSSAGPFIVGDGNNSVNLGIICFPETGDEEHKAIKPHEGDEHEHRGEGSFSIHQGRVQEGRGGRAEAGFFFHGSTHTEVEIEGKLVFVEVLYHLQLTGAFNTAFLPPIGENSVVLSMTGWKLTATNESKAVKRASCIGKGEVNVDVTVTEHDPDAEHGHEHD